MPRQKKDFSHDQLEDILDVFQSESDRACAVLGASYLEYLLAKAIIKAMPHGEEISQGFLYGPLAPLGTFWSRIEAAYGLGLISNEIRSDLHTIRDLRNDFAHELEIHSFEQNNHIRDLTRNLKLGTRFAQGYKEPYRSNLLSPRNVFISTVVELQDELRVLAGIEKKKPSRVLMSKKLEETRV